MKKTFTNSFKIQAVEKAGLQVGGSSQASMAKQYIMLRNAVGMLRIGEKISLEIVRDGRKLTIKARIAEPKRVRVETAGLPEKFSGAVFRYDRARLYAK